MSLRYLLLSVAFLAILSRPVQAQIQDEIICPGTIYMISEDGECGSKVQCSSPFKNVELDNVQNNYPTDSWFETGSTSVYFKGMDNENNTHFCVFKVHVLDKEIPEVTSDFSEIMAFTQFQEKSAQVKWELPQASDNCDIVKTISSHKSGDYFPLGETQVTYWFYDSAGNSTEFSFTVMVKSGESSLAEKE